MMISHEEIGNTMGNLHVPLIIKYCEKAWKIIFSKKCAGFLSKKAMNGIHIVLWLNWIWMLTSWSSGKLEQHHSIEQSQQSRASNKYSAEYKKSRIYWFPHLKNVYILSVCLFMCRTVFCWWIFVKLELDWILFCTNWPATEGPIGFRKKWHEI